MTNIQAFILSTAIMAAGADTVWLRSLWTIAFCANVILATIAGSFGGKR